MMRQLIRKMIQLGFDWDLTETIASALETDNQYEAMLQWLDGAINPTREELLIMAIVIADEE